MQTGAAECCTKPCEVLGTGPPLWSVMDPTNPSTGGVSLTYWGVPSLPDDGFKCPADNITGALLGVHALNFLELFALSAFI